MNSSQEQGTSASARSEESGLQASLEEENDIYRGLDDIPGNLFLCVLFIVWGCKTSLQLNFSVWQSKQRTC